MVTSDAPLYLLRYDVVPKSIADDVVIVARDDSAVVISRSPARVLEAERTERAMSGPHARLADAYAALATFR